MENLVESRVCTFMHVRTQLTQTQICDALANGNRIPRDSKGKIISFLSRKSLALACGTQ